MWSSGHAESQAAASSPSLCVTHYLLSKFFNLKNTRNSPKSACYAMAVNARCSFLEVSEYIQVCRTMLTMIKKPLIKAFKINKESVSMSSQRPFPCREKGPPTWRKRLHAPLCCLFFQVWDLSLTIPGPAPPVSHLSTGANSSRAWAELAVFAGCSSSVTGPAAFLSCPEASWSKKLWRVPGRNSGFVLHLANDSPVREASGFSFRGCSGRQDWPHPKCLPVALKVTTGNLCSHCGDQLRRFLKSKNRAPIWPSYATPERRPEASESADHRQICTSMFTVALFTSAKIWTEMPVRRWLKKMRYIYTS